MAGRDQLMSKQNAASCWVRGALLLRLVCSSRRGPHRFSTGSDISGDVVFSRAVAALLLFTRGWKVTSSGYLRMPRRVSRLTAMQEA